MSWTAPPTFVSGAALTAAQLNILSGDLNETAAAKATAAGQTFFSTAANTLAARTPAGSDVTGSDQSTSSTSFVDLGTVGPTVTATTGSRCLVAYGCICANDTVGGYAEMSFVVSGATTIAVGTYQPLRHPQMAFAGAKTSYSKCNWVAPNSGSNTFKAQYRALSAGTATFNARELMIIPMS